MQELYFGLVWDNYMGSGYVKAISREEYVNHKAGFDSPYWGVYNDFNKAQSGLNYKLIN
jgi:hypothetical protein